MNCSMILNNVLNDIIPKVHPIQAFERCFYPFIKNGIHSYGSCKHERPPINHSALNPCPNTMFNHWILWKHLLFNKFYRRPRIVWEYADQLWYRQCPSSDGWKGWIQYFSFRHFQYSNSIIQNNWATNYKTGSFWLYPLISPMKSSTICARGQKLSEMSTSVLKPTKKNIALSFSSV